MGKYTIHGNIHEVPVVEELEESKQIMKAKIETKTHRVLFPFTAIVGQEKMKRALILNAINPSIGGVLIRGQKGTAKSTAVRGLAEILPEIEVVSGCTYSCDPHDEEKFCWECQIRQKE
ncbi:MAG: hypothetical protein M8353_11645, partial [ANME-2 cluster archaeon]|nr:hypothetical protein [ANME-2 cluster archaeon]